MRKWSALLPDLKGHLVEHPTWAYAPLKHITYLAFANSYHTISLNLTSFVFCFCWPQLTLLNDKAAPSDRSVTCLLRWISMPFPKAVAINLWWCCPLGTFCDVWRYFWWSQLGEKCYQCLVHRYAKYLETHFPSTKNYLVQNVNHAEIERPCPNAINSMDVSNPAVNSILEGGEGNALTLLESKHRCKWKWQWPTVSLLCHGHLGTCTRKDKPLYF